MNGYRRDLIMQERRLKEQLCSSKMFLNMCVHDLKNPTVSITQGLQLTTDNLNDFNKIYEDHVIFSQKCKSLHQNDVNQNQGICEISLETYVKLLYNSHTKYFKQAKLEVEEVRDQLHTIE